MAGWTDGELRAAVRSYLAMLRAQEAGEQCSKAEQRRRLMAGPLRRRSPQSIEYRMRNISAVMDERGRPTISGYLPAENVGRAIRDRLWSLLQEESGMAAAKRPPMVFFNVGWMDEYRGLNPAERTLGNHGFLKEHQHGFESFNFLEVDGVVRGYRPGHEADLRIDRIGAARGDPAARGVLVVWLAREPRSGQTLVVGWYRDATVYRSSQYGPAGTRSVEGREAPYSAETKASEARVLPPLAREFRVESRRTSPNGFGQSPVWYGSDEVNERVWQYILSVGHAGAKRGVPIGRHRTRPPRNLDPELRRKVERAAVDHATAFYESPEGGLCKVVSVEVEGRGWDLEVAGDGVFLLVEVKGLQGSELVCELTPNEYEKMRAPEHRDRYVVYVVSNALSGPIASRFHHAGDGQWVTADGRRLVVKERTGAVLSLANPPPRKR